MTDTTRLVLTRKTYQSINIGGLVTVTVEEIRGKTVRIVVEAPRGIAVHRQEIYERILSGGGDDRGTGACVLAGPLPGPGGPPGRSEEARVDLPAVGRTSGGMLGQDVAVVRLHPGDE
jgi:carbon storage regulator